MILFVVLHLLRVFFQAAYKYPRELTWVMGVGLLGVTMGFGFTGYLLPWDQRAYWATVVGTEIAGSVPIIGDAAPAPAPRRRGRHRRHHEPVLRHPRPRPAALARRPAAAST